jgi:hypothetical protein
MLVIKVAVTGSLVNRHGKSARRIKDENLTEIEQAG